MLLRPGETVRLQEASRWLRNPPQDGTLVLTSQRLVFVHQYHDPTYRVDRSGTSVEVPLGAVANLHTAPGRAGLLGGRRASLTVESGAQRFDFLVGDSGRWAAEIAAARGALPELPPPPPPPPPPSAPAGAGGPFVVQVMAPAPAAPAAPTVMLRCRYCGNLAPPTESRCPRCGAAT